jgi:hypothetical protein
MDNVQIFIEQLLRDKDMPELDQDVKDQLVKDLSDRLTKYINKRVIESLPEEDLPELEQLIDSENPDQTKIQEYIATKSIDLVGVTTKAMDEFRKIYLGE